MTIIGASSLTLADRIDQAAQAEKARRDLLTFLDYVRVLDPSEGGAGYVTFSKPPHLLRLHQACETLPPGEVLPVLKARKVFVTSYFEAKALHDGMYHPNVFIPITSQGEQEAKEFIRGARFMWASLPDELRVPLKKGEDSTETLGFVGGGRIQAFPATEHAGRSYTGTWGLMDEADFHKAFLAAFEAQLPLYHSTGGRLYVVSTPNYEQVDSPFRQLYQKSARHLYVGYFDRPGRTEETYQHARAQSLDVARFEKENSRTEEEALAPPRALAYFDPDVLQEMLAHMVTSPWKQEGYLSLWKPPAVGRHYVMGADTAWGKTGSYNCAAVSEWETAEQVAELHGRLHPNDMAYEVVELHKRYNHAFMGLERAGEGQERDGDSVVVVDKVVELLRDCSCAKAKRLPMLYYHDHLAPEPKVPGWQTDGKSRPMILGEFREAVRERQVTLHSRAGLGEMMTFIQGENGRAEAAKGAFDDRVLAYAIMWQMRKYAKFQVTTNRGPIHVPGGF